MKCNERQQLFAYTQGMLEPREEGEVRAHLGQCAVCRGVVDEFRGLESVLDEWKPTEPSAWFDARVRAAVAAAGQPHRSSVWSAFRWRPWLSPVLLGVLVVVVSVAFVRTRRSHNHAQPGAQQDHLGSKQPALAEAQAGAATPAEDELVMYQNLPVLEDSDYDLLANFDLLSDLPREEKKVTN